MSVEILISVVVVTGVLVYFLQNDYAFLFGLHQCRFLITDQTEAELYARYPECIAKYEAALATNQIEKIRVDNADALQAYVRYSAAHCISPAECEALAATVQEDASIMVEDRTATKLFAMLKPDVNIFTTKKLLSDIGISPASINVQIFSFANLASA